MQTQTLKRAGPREAPRPIAGGLSRACDAGPGVSESADDINTLIPSFLHDANGALFVVLQFAELLTTGCEGSLSESQQRMLRVVHDRAYATHDVLESLRAAVKLDNGHFACQAHPCRIEDVLELALPRMQRRAQAKRGSIVTEVSKSPPPVSCDPNAMSLALVNLYYHISSRLHESFSITLTVDHAEESRRVVCRFLLNDADALGKSVKPDGDAYLRVATALAELCHSVVMGADPGVGQLAALAVPVAECRAPRSPAKESSCRNAC